MKDLIRSGLPAAIVVSILMAGSGVGIAAPQSQQLPQPGVTSALIDPASLAREDLSPGFLGLYRKVMEIEDEIRAHAERYELDYDLARAVCLYESGGNAGLTSWAGAEGYFQVMPATFRTLGVDGNIEAGVKYLAQLVDRFEREDYALAAYNGGPGTVGRSRPMRLESLQYVIGVGHYRMMLKLYEEPIRRHASELQLEVAREGDTWWSVSRRLGIPLVQLRLYNPYIGIREMRPGFRIAHPPAARDDLYMIDGDTVHYRSRLGDNYFGIGFAFDVPLDGLRGENKLWHLQTLPPGMDLRLPLAWRPEDDDDRDRSGAESVDHTIAQGDTIESIRARYRTSEWRIVRDNRLWDEQLPPAGTVLAVTLDAVEPQYTEHTVARGENLSIIASRYGTSVGAIQEANAMGSGTVLQVGQQLRVPSR